MAYTSGTADDYLDLLDILADFVTTTMDPEGERWSVLRDSGASPRELVLQGPGLSGDDEIKVGIRTSVGADYGNWELKGFSAFNDALAWGSQLNASGSAYSLQLNTAMPYWIVANGRRIIVAAKASIYYTCAYLGLFLPYATPAQYPLPMFVGGSSTTDSRYTSGGTAFPISHSILGMLTPSAWVAATLNAGVDLNTLRELPDGSYPLYPVRLQLPSPNQTIGELDGVFRLAGYNQTAENIVTVGGIDHLVLPNVNVSGRASMWALRLD